MNLEDYKIAYENVMVANKMLEQEIERLNKEREIDIKYNKYLQKELAKANNIIKEVREYVDKWEDIARYKLLEMLDKGSDEISK